ncbi:MAG: tryptophan-rich sensory protein [Fretibacterium sp.]|nr:tryptophan-rich sensory protein [Fretibacterium sp.]
MKSKSWKAYLLGVAFTEVVGVLSALLTREGTFWLLALLALASWMTLSFRRVDLLSAALQIPYLLWLFFAGYLSFSVWMLNGAEL